METKQALNILYGAIQQAMASGLFKDFKSLDTVRQALAVVEQTIIKKEIKEDNERILHQ